MIGFINFDESINLHCYFFLACNLFAWSLESNLATVSDSL